MDQALSLYLLDTIPLVDPQQQDLRARLLTLVESILEAPIYPAQTAESG